MGKAMPVDFESAALPMMQPYKDPLLPEHPVNNLPDTGHLPFFIPAEKHEGSKPGYAFKAGKQGVGYYRDGMDSGTFRKESSCAMGEPPELEKARGPKSGFDLVPPNQKLDRWEFCHHCQGEGMVNICEPVSSANPWNPSSKMTRTLRETCNKCGGEGMIEKTNKGAQKVVEEEKEEEEKEVTPHYTCHTEADVVLEKATGDTSTEVTASTGQRWLVCRVDLPLVESASEIDAEVVDQCRLELEVPEVYWLEAPLGYQVEDEAMQCAFCKKSHVLTIRLPIIGHQHEEEDEEAVGGGDEALEEVLEEVQLEETDVLEEEEGAGGQRKAEGVKQEFLHHQS